jgi:uncharacterized membrane protein YdcZ (DUF606 family)
MQKVLTKEPSAQTAHFNSTMGPLIRRWAFGAGTALLVIVAVVSVAAPDLMTHAPFWFGWSAGALGVVAAYVVARGQRRRSPGRQSRRMQRFVSCD